MEKDNKLLWILKGISCIIVILFHCPLAGIAGDVIIYSMRFPIPVFLMISGYYSFRKNNYLRYAKKTFHLLVIGEVISAIVIEICFWTGLSKINAFQIVINTNWIKTILFGSLFNSTLWYLYATFWGWILFYLLSKTLYGFRVLKWSIIPLLTMHILGRMIITKYGDIEHQVFWFRSTILFVLPFFMIGRLIAEYKEKIKNCSDMISIILIVAGTMLIVVEYLIWHQYMDLQVSTVFVSIGLFTFAIKNPDFAQNNILTYIGHISQDIYLLHIPVITFLKPIWRKILPGKLKIFPYIVIAVTIIIASAYVNVKKHVMKIK